MFTYIYYSESHECFTHDLMTKFKLSKQSVYKHLKPLVEAKLLEKIRTSANLYNALKAPHEIEVKSHFSRGMTSHIRSHALGFSFKILQNADKIKFTSKINLNNWTRQMAKIDRCTVFKHPKKLIIYVPEQRGSDARDNEIKAQTIALNLSQKLIDRYNLVLSLPKLVQKPHHAVISPITKKIAQRTLKEVGTIKSEAGFIDDSEKTGQGEMELLSADDANAMLNMGKEINEMKSLLMGSLNTQKSIANTQLIIATGFKEMQKEIRLVSLAVRKVLSQKHIKDYL